VIAFTVVQLSNTTPILLRSVKSAIRGMAWPGSAGARQSRKAGPGGGVLQPEDVQACRVLEVPLWMLDVGKKSTLPGGVHGSMQISVLPFDPDVGFIDAIASVGPLQVSAAAVVQFRPLDCTQRQMELGWMSRPRSSAPSRPCAQMRSETSSTARTRE
jgi:hypothetical protein